MAHLPTSQPDANPNPFPWWSLAGLVEDVAPHLGFESRHHLQHALAVARTFPADLADRFYFEDRGEGSGRPMDFIIGVGDAGQRILAGRNPALSLAAAVKRDPVWSGIRRLARRWSVASDPLNAIERILFEFDAPPRASATLGPCLPGVFIQLPVSEPATSPGNVRELRSSVETGYYVTSERVIRTRDIWEALEHRSNSRQLNWSTGFDAHAFCDRLETGEIDFRSGVRSELKPNKR